MNGKSRIDCPLKRLGYSSSCEGEERTDRCRYFVEFKRYATFDNFMGLKLEELFIRAVDLVTCGLRPRLKKAILQEVSYNLGIMCCILRITLRYQDPEI